MDVANSLVTCALYRARLYPSPQILMFTPGLPPSTFVMSIFSQSIELILMEDVT